jgi:HEAT repeat protein
MKKIFFILCLLLMLLGCTPQSVVSPTETEASLPSEFESEFDRLFLSQEPLRYQDNVQFLESILELELDTEEQELVSAKLKEFLTAALKPRPYAPDSIHTGVASEIAFLRLQAVQLLGEIGLKEDVEFIRNLEKLSEEHPLFDEECQKAIEKLKNKQQSI